MPEDGVQLRDKKEFMTSEEIYAIAKTFVDLGVKKIRLTGGEPLIKKDIANILKTLSSLPIELGISTNGILVDRYTETFKKYGVQSVNVSLDSLNEQRSNQISRRNYFTRIMSNIQLLLDQNFKVKLNVVLIKGTNEDEILDFVDFTRERNVSVRFIEFMPFIGNNWDLERTVSYKSIIDKVVDCYGSEQLEKLTDNKNDTASNYKIKGFIGSFGIISTVTNPFCDSCNRIRLTANGRIKNCLFSTSETDLLTAYRQGKDLNQLIAQTICSKKKIRSGTNSFENSTSYLKNRSMVTIGG